MQTFMLKQKLAKTGTFSITREKRIKLMWPPKMASMGTLSRTLEKGKN
jgi:hypothetical protein